jgi:hypothetical protein
MLEEILSQIKAIHVQQPITWRNLSVYPLRHRTDSSLSYLTLAEALQQGNGAFHIKEVSHGGSVPELWSSTA